MILQECLEVFLAVFGEKESVDLGTELLECEVGWGEEGTASVWCLFDSFEETGLRETKGQGAEFSWE